MKHFLIVSLALLTGCLSLSSSREDKHQMELGLRKMRTDLEEIRQDCNTYEVGHHLLEGKLLEQERILSALKQRFDELRDEDSPLQEVQVLTKEVDQLSKRQENIISDIRQLSSYANETTTALSQYKDKIAQLETLVTLQTQQINTLIKLKDSIEEFSQTESQKTYIVKSGDSLEKIAREHGTSVEKLKKLNQITSDVIVVDQQLYLP